MLPHWQIGGYAYHSVSNVLRGTLSAEERDMVVEVVRRGEDSFFRLYVGAVMPDHMHLILGPFEAQGGAYHDLAKVTMGASARRINQARGCMGHLWQTESYDRMIRCQDEMDKTWDYVLFNPVVAGLCERPENYPWLIFPEWRE